LPTPTTATRRADLFGAPHRHCAQLSVVSGEWYRLLLARTTAPAGPASRKRVATMVPVSMGRRRSSPPFDDTPILGLAAIQA
jgi:hypothetical protein